jgi:hypothetical protein
LRSQQRFNGSRHALANCRPLWRDHFKLVDYLYRLFDVECQRFEARMYIYVSFLCDLILRYDVQVGKTLVQKSGDIVRLLQNLRVDIVVYEREQFLENALDILDFV